MALNGLFVAKTIEKSLDAPLPLVLALNSFATDFSSEASAAASITTRFASAGTTSTNYGAQSGNSTAVTINLNTPCIASYSFSEMNIGQTLTPETLANLYVVPAINSVAQAVTQAAIGLFTSGNFSNGIVVANPTGFSLGTLTSGNAVLDTLFASPIDRYAIFAPSYKASLLNNNVYIQTYSFGNSDAIQKGVLPPIFGIQPMNYNSTISSTDGNLVGAIFQKNAVAIAARPPAYDESQGYGFVENFVEPNTKLPLQLRMWNDMNGLWRLSVGTIYGVAAGVNQAVRITNS